MPSSSVSVTSAVVGAGAFVMRDCAAQRQQFAARLVHVDVDRIERLNRCEHLILIRFDQRALRQIRTADLAGDRRGDARVAERDARRFDVGLLLLDVCQRLLQRGLRVVVVLLADRLLFAQRHVAIGFQLRGGERGFRVRELRLGAAVRGLIQRVVDLIQRLARLNDAALGEQPLLQNAVHLRAHVGDFVRQRPPGQFGGEHRLLRLNRDHAHFGRAALRRPALSALATAGQRAAPIRATIRRHRLGRRMETPAITIRPIVVATYAGSVAALTGVPGSRA